MLLADVHRRGPGARLPSSGPSTAWGGLDVVVANAGVQLAGQDDRADRLSLEVWQRTIDINLTGVFLTCKHGLRALLASGGGAVVCTCSPTGQYGVAPGYDAYSSSKAGVYGLVRVMAADYAAEGIRVNGVIPGTPHPDDTGSRPDAETLLGIPLGGRRAEGGRRHGLPGLRPDAVRDRRGVGGRRRDDRGLMGSDPASVRVARSSHARDKPRLLLAVVDGCLPRNRHVAVTASDAGSDPHRRPPAWVLTVVGRPLPHTMEGVTASEQPLIEAAGVTKRFGHVTALDDVSTSVTSPRSACSARTAPASRRS